MVRCLIALLVAGPAVAADVTDIAEPMHGDLRIDYAGSLQFGTVDERGTDFGSRRVDRHDLLYTVEFVPTAGVAIVVKVDHTPVLRVSHDGATQMAFDPVSGGGSYVGGQALEARTLSGTGVSGLWFGAGVAPFSERYHRSNDATWRLDTAVRTPNPKHTFWTADGDRRGAAPGGVAWLLQGAFSTNRGVLEPYVVGSYLLEGKARVDVVDEDGTVRAADVEVDPADRVDLRAGIEVIASENAERGDRFAFDFFAGAGYQTWSDIPSGVLLQGVLETRAGSIVAGSQRIGWLGGMGVDYQINPYVGLRLGIEGRYTIPYRIEHPYPAMTGTDTWELGIAAAVRGRAP